MTTIVDFSANQEPVYRSYLNVHGPVDGSEDGLALVAAVLVALFDRFRLPVGPVDKVLEDGHGEDVVQPRRRVVAAAEDDARPPALQIGHGDVVLARVRPKQFARLVRNGQRVRPTCFFLKIYFFSFLGSISNRVRHRVPHCTSELGGITTEKRTVLQRGRGRSCFTATDVG